MQYCETLKISRNQLYFIFAESTWPHRRAAVHPPPIQLHNIHHYENLFHPGRPYALEVGHWKVGVDDAHEYIIGLVALGILCPFLAPRADLHHTYERVKIRINGDNATEIVPISNEDSLNLRFFQEYETDNIRFADIRE